MGICQTPVYRAPTSRSRQIAEIAVGESIWGFPADSGRWVRLAFGMKVDDTRAFTGWSPIKSLGNGRNKLLLRAKWAKLQVIARSPETLKVEWPGLHELCTPCQVSYRIDWRVARCSTSTQPIRYKNVGD